MARPSAEPLEQASSESPRGGALAFATATLATWRLTHLIAEEDGPFELIVRLRAAAGDSVAGELMDCFYCLSLWVAAPFAATTARRRRAAPARWLAISGAACLLERLTGGAPPAS